MAWLKRLLDNNVKLYDKYAYIRLAEDRGHHHLQWFQNIYQHIPEMVFGGAFISYTYIKDWLHSFPIWLYACIALAYILTPTLLNIWIGHIDLQNDLMSRDIKLKNKYNKELMKILENTNEKTKKTGKGIVDDVSKKRY